MAEPVATEDVQAILATVEANQALSAELAQVKAELRRLKADHGLDEK